ncbi:MAG: glycosyltransferase family 2 protein [Deltaproteobacteria bacterium]|nr:glycosyltransferase family 2 protein [Deltaproteobacteria bacterium]
MPPVSPMSVSVIVPVHGGGEDFERCLSSLIACNPAPEEIVVVADGPSDGAWRAAEAVGIPVFKLSRTGGPARARNRGADKARGDILFFVDADVTVPPDAIRRVRSAFQHTPQPAAVFGSYDDEPGKKNFLSQYKNLFHHHVHQAGAVEASTFWGACGAIRRDVFMEMGGFDETYRHPSIEDIELGYRLRRNGQRIRLDKDLQVKHLKRWDLGSLLKADIFYRALPWTGLILGHGSMNDDLNLKVGSRMTAAACCLLMVVLAASVFVSTLLVAAAALILALLWRDRETYRFFMKKRGLWFAIRTVPMVWLYYLYGSAAFAVGYVRHLYNRRARAG